ncbi:hypothetical protein NDU88_003198 [Pleurodeles waltl]|uniref:Pentapeptide repeat-containing protein n=1 Tax=Pleurodeles waltl TaxID=8319 RepID=A0AAV7NIJ4_PLEWA|nr:hypothetical protein NDU88_003198 [Pleurodeles waltl]
MQLCINLLLGGKQLKPQALLESGKPGINDAGINDAGINDAGINDAGINDAGLPLSKSARGLSCFPLSS